LIDVKFFFDLCSRKFCAVGVTIRMLCTQTEKEK